MDVYKTESLDDVDSIVSIHLSAFPGFFLTFLGKGFLKYLYRGFIEHNESGIIVAKEDTQLLGFLAYSSNISNFYSYLLKQYFFIFAWYGFLGAIRSPKSVFRIVRALRYPKIKKKNEDFIEISSIAVDPSVQAKGVGSSLINALWSSISQTTTIEGVCLETDAENNDVVNNFYQRNGFVLMETWTSRENRKMNGYQRKLKD